MIDDGDDDVGDDVGDGDGDGDGQGGCECDDCGLWIVVVWLWL